MKRVSLFFFNKCLLCLGLVILGVVGCSPKILIKGRVVRESGNQMPSPDLPPAEPKGYNSTVYFFEPFKPQYSNMSSSLNGVFKEIRTKEIARVKTDVEGFFRIKLFPGNYSVVTAMDSVRFYGAVQDGEGFVNRYSFKKGQRYNLQLKANWDAVY